MLDLPQDGRGRGYAINLGGDARTLKVKGAKHLGTYHAVMREEGKRATRSKAERRFCLKCGSALWLWDPRWPELIHPHASAIDTPLPKPPEVVEAALDFAVGWEDAQRPRPQALRALSVRVAGGVAPAARAGGLKAQIPEACRRVRQQKPQRSLAESG